MTGGQDQLIANRVGGRIIALRRPYFRCGGVNGLKGTDRLSRPIEPILCGYRIRRAGYAGRVDDVTGVLEGGEKFYFGLGDSLLHIGGNGIAGRNTGDRSPGRFHVAAEPGEDLQFIRR